jgi:hypothetical protein
MPFKLDHVIYHVYDLQAAIAHEQAQGFHAFYGGVHANGTTHNALVCFQDGSYRELMASTGSPPLNPNAMDFSMVIRGKPEGIVGWAISTVNLDADIATLRAQGVPVEDALVGHRERPDGTILRWRLSWIDLKLSILLIQDVTDRVLRVPDDPQTNTHANGTTGIDALILPALLEDPTHLTTLFGKPASDSDGSRTYSLSNCRLIMSPSAMHPEIRYT